MKRRLGTQALLSERGVTLYNVFECLLVSRVGVGVVIVGCCNGNKLKPREEQQGTEIGRDN